MDENSILGELIDLAEQLGVQVRRAPASEFGQHPGGAHVRLGQKEMLFLDPAAGIADQISVAIQCLRTRDELAERFLPPEIRDLLDAPDATGA